MRKIDYDANEKYTGSTETHVAVDEAMDPKGGNLQNAYEEGFASASGVRNGTAETGGRLKHPEKADRARVDGRAANPVDNENSGLAE